MAEPQPAPDKPDSDGKWMYGVTVVLAGLLVILLAYVLTLKEFDKAADVATALAPLTGVVGTLVGAYFGVQVGAAGKDKAEAARAKSDEEAKAALAALPPDAAQEVRRSLR